MPVMRNVGRRIDHGTAADDEGMTYPVLCLRCCSRVEFRSAYERDHYSRLHARCHPVGP